MEEKKLNISNAELDIMKVIWSYKNTTSRDVINILSETNSWKPTTIKTMLARLVDKNVLIVKKEGNKNIYIPLMTEKEAQEAIFNDAAYKICSKGIGKMIKYLIESNELNSKDIEDLKITLSKKEANNNIKCNCIKKFGRCTCNHK